MTAEAIANPLPLFIGLNGLPLTGGSVYFGAVGQDPRSAPLDVFWDEGLTIPAQQPLTTHSGYLYRNGAPSSVWCDSDYSVLVLDSTGRQVFYSGAAPKVSDRALNLASYAELRAFTGNEPRVYLTGYLVTAAPAGIAGMFVRDDTDTTTADDGGITIVDASGRRWKRQFDGMIQTKWFECDRTGTTVTTAALQKAFDTSKTEGVGLYVNEGTYLHAGVKMYSFQRVEFDPGAMFKMSADGFCIRTVLSIGDALPTGNIIRAQLVNARVDMDNHNGFAVLWECVTSGLVGTPRVTNIGTGTYSYDDGNGAFAYPTAGVALKGISGVQGCYWNIVDGPRMNGAGNRGIWLGTSFGRTMVAGTYSKANNNTIRNALCTTQTVGIDLHCADDNIIVQPDVTSCTTGILSGVGGGGVYFCNRNKIERVYAEGNTTGVNITDESSSTSVSFTSVTGTTNPYTDNGYETEIIYPKRLGSGDWARFYDTEVRGVSGVQFLASRVASSDANTLDDYEEGTYTPAVVGTSTTGTVTNTNQVGKYTMVGDLVFFEQRNNYTGGTGIGNLRIAGLPVNADANFNHPVTVRAANLTFAGQLTASIVPGDNVIDFYTMASGAALSAVAYDAAADIYVSGFYKRV